MAKYENEFTGDFHEFLSVLENGILKGSVSASLEGKSNYQTGDVRCAVRVFERYSALGSNRVSLNVTVISTGEKIFLSAITSGGSQAVFFKLNTIGEETFLEQVPALVDDYLDGQ